MYGTRFVTPVLLYREPEFAARWLTEAFGAERDVTWHAPSGDIDYIALRLGQSRILICSRPSGSPDGLARREPREFASTQMCYLAVDDVEQHFARARACGAGIVSEPRDDGDGGRFYICRDCEAHVWSVGTQVYGARPAVQEPRQSRVLAGLSVVLGLTVLLMTGGWLAYQADPEAARAAAAAVLTTWKSEARAQSSQAEPEAAAREVPGRQPSDATLQLEAERAAHGEQVRSLQDDLARAARTHEGLERAAVELRNRLAAAERAAKDGAVSLALEQMRAKTAEGQLNALQGDWVKEAVKREELHRAAGELRNKLAAAEQSAKDGAVALALERARTEVAVEKLGALQGKLDQLEAGLAVEQALRASAVADAAAPVLSACAMAAQGKVRLQHNGPKRWDAANLRRLCGGAASSAEPARCYDHLMSGQVAWGGGGVWQADNALALCGGTHRASQTIACFRNAIALGQGWRTATQRCGRLRATADRLSQ